MLDDPSHFDVLLTGGRVGGKLCDVGVVAGRVASLGDLSAEARRGAARQHLDCAGLEILPGVIDSQVHFREPGGEHKENLESGSRAALLGGVTSVFDMPNTSPPTTSAARLEEKMSARPRKSPLSCRILHRRRRAQSRPTRPIRVAPALCGR